MLAGSASAGGELVLGRRESALFFKSPLSERRHAASSDFWKTVLAESRRPRTSPRRSRRPDSIPFPGVPSTIPSAQKKDTASKKRSAFPYSRYCQKSHQAEA